MFVMFSCGIAHAESEVVYQTIAMESANQSDRGMELVSHVIINRARIGNISPESVVLRRKQFSCWNDLAWSKAWLARYYTELVRKRAILAYSEALASQSYTTITHYHHVNIKPYWSVGHKPSVVECDHAFYEGIR